MSNLRNRAIADMKRLNLRDWSGVVELTDPDGEKYTTDDETGEELKAVQILYDYRRIDPLTGEFITVNEPVVTVALSSLARVPVAGEKWHVRIPEDPDATVLSDFVLDASRAPEGGRSLGFIRLYPHKAVQS